MAKIQNKKARFNYTIEETFEGGLVLKGWEVKSIREGRAQITDAHIYVYRGELFLLNAQVVPLSTVSTHERPEPTRTRKILMHKKEIERLIGRVERSGYTLIPLEMYFSKGKVKLGIGLGKGKKLYEKRDDIGEREWKRTQERLLKNRVRKSI